MSTPIESHDLDDWDEDLVDSFFQQQEDQPWEDEIQHEQREIVHIVREDCPIIYNTE